MRGTMLYLFAFSLAFFSLVGPQGEVLAAELYQDLQGVWRAEVTDVRDQREEQIPGTDVTTDIQTIDARLLEGDRKGERIVFENDYIQLKKGDKFFVNYLVTIDGSELYSVKEVDRRSSMFFLIALFVAAVVALSGFQGVRSLLSLVGSLLIIVFVLIPLLMKGFSPVLTSVSVGAIILFIAIFFTHGFNRFSTIAYLGTVIAVALSGLLAAFAVSFTSLTGFASDEAIYLNLSTAGELNFVGILLAAIIVGSLGVLDDIAITQVAVVRELYGALPDLSKKEAFIKALRVGKDHVSALVNTLVLAYTGAALPLLLLFSTSDAGILSILNREVFAAEIVRTVVGSIGLIMTVPITTFLAAWVLRGRSGLQEGGVAPHAHTHIHS